MTNLEEYDLVVLGSGEPGKYLAWTLGAQRRRVAIIERRYIGGSCPNIACLPSKTVIHTANVISLIRRGKEFGIAPAERAVDMATVRARKRAMVAGLVETHLERNRASGAELVMGHGRFIAPRTIEVTLNDGGTRTLRGTIVIINTGSRAKVDAIPGCARQRP